jgi:hypothetical protein
MSWFEGTKVRVGLFEYGTVVRQTFNCNGFLDVVFEDGRKDEVFHRDLIVLTTPIIWCKKENRWRRWVAIESPIQEYVDYNKSK